MKKQVGFTLIELAIVLVIIGLLLGGVLKGQELINSAKVKNMASDFRNIQVQIYSYQDKFRALPGDDRAAQTHVSSVAATNGNGNGIIEGACCNGAGGISTGEAFQVWQQLRLAGLATGTTDTGAGAYQPTNAEGGVVGIQSNPQLAIQGLTGSYGVCSSGILGRFARELDTVLDDGSTTTGSMMSAAAVTGAAGAVPVASTTPDFDSTKYVVCMAF